MASLKKQAKLLDCLRQVRRSALRILDPATNKAPPASNSEATEPSSQEADLVGKRRVIQAPVLEAPLFPENATEILIKAQPAANEEQCIFTVNQTLMNKCSWYFHNSSSIEGSPLIEALFALEEVETVLLCESQIIITPKGGRSSEWESLATTIGAVMREVLESGGPLIAESILAQIPPTDEVRSTIQQVIDDVVNPGIAGHGGHVSLVSVERNSITIKMGGGCQGCSAADQTLKHGIHTAFRSALPTLGGIFDETDHAAGVNPYFS